MKKEEPLIKRVAKSAGPGVITGIADDDPSGIATYSQTGAMFGYSQLWLALFSIPFMIAIQEMCGRIGMVTGKGIAGLIKIHYSKKILYGAVCILALTNIINIGADLGAMAEAARLIIPASFGPLLIGITLFTVIAQVFIPYKTYVTFLKYLALTVFSYIIAAFFIDQDWHKVLISTIIPHFEWNKGYLLNITAMLGTTISPYLFFWQASEEVEEEIVSGKIRAMGKGIPKIGVSDVAQMKSDTAVGMFISNVVTFFIITTAASTLGANGITQITSAAQVAEALRPFAGDASFLLFTLGILGTGLLAVPVLAGSAGYAISEAFGWKGSLGKSFSQARAFYFVIIVATLLGALVNFSSINAMTMLYYAAAFNGLLAPPLMVIILLIANNKKIMGSYTNSRLSNIFGWAITAIMGIISLVFVGSFFT